MADAAKVLFLAGPVDAPGDADRLAGLMDRLEAQGIDAQGLCASLPERNGSGRLLQCPGLVGRWARLTAARRAEELDGLHPPELLHALTPLVAPAALGLAERWRVPYLLTVDEFLPPGGRLRVSRSWARGLVVPCEALAIDLIHGLGVPQALVSIIPPGVRVPEAPEQASGMGPGSGRVTVIGAAAALRTSSGLATFLQAARQLVDSGLDVEFVIAGRGPGEGGLRALADRLEITARLTFVAAADEAFWTVLDVLCQTSLVPTAGHAMIQAMARGVPVVSTEVEGIRGLIGSMAGIGPVVPPSRPDAMAEAVTAILSDRERAKAEAKTARELVAQQFDLDREAGALASLFRRVLEARLDTTPATVEPCVRPGLRTESQPGAPCPGGG